MSEMKKLYKSRTDRMVDGVCGGIAEYFGFDVTLVRIGWVFLALLGGSGILLYILAMIVMPVSPTVSAISAPQKDRSSSNQKFWGFLLVGVGVVLLMNNLGFTFWNHWWDFSWDIVLAVILILAGVAFLFGGRNGITTPADAAAETTKTDPATGQDNSEPIVEPVRRLYRTRRERKLFGVCGGLADYFSIDPTIIRLLFVVSAIASFGFTVFGYFIMAIVVPEQPLEVRA